jgi:RND family efflux transporter MFP subunit
MGLVKPAREVSLKAQAGGEVVEVSPNLLEGQHVSKGELLVRIEAADYELAVARAASALATRESELALEMGFQRVAKREWELLSDGDADASLALREPQLKQAKANRDSAQAELAQASINLERTLIKAPFNAVVMSRSVELGSLATTNSEVANLVSTDSFHVFVSIPEAQIPMLKIPGARAEVQVRGADVPLPGEVISLMSELDLEGRMARVLVEVKDPLGLLPENQSRPKLLLGAYVEVRFEGKSMPGAFTIPRSALRNGDVVWLMRENSTLEIRRVEVAWRNRGSVILRSGVAAGEKLITSPLSLASEGMQVTTADAAARKAKSGQGSDKADQAAKSQK